MYEKRVFRGAIDGLKGAAMKMAIKTLMVGLVLVMFSATQPVSAAGTNWFGRWDFNHDGHQGTLVIQELPADCATLGCNWNIYYLNKQNQQYEVRLDRFSNNGFQLRFHIMFPGGSGQVFDAYLFSWDDTKMAGTTVWEGTQFGFMANKRR
jgi:hypothetical protein